MKNVDHTRVLTGLSLGAVLVWATPAFGQDTVRLDPTVSVGIACTSTVEQLAQAYRTGQEGVARAYARAIVGCVSPVLTYDTARSYTLLTWVARDGLGKPTIYRMLLEPPGAPRSPLHALRLPGLQRIATPVSPPPSVEPAPKSPTTMARPAPSTDSTRPEWTVPDVCRATPAAGLVTPTTAETNAAGLDVSTLGLVQVFLSSAPGTSLASILTSTRVDDPLQGQIPAVAQAILPGALGAIDKFAPMSPRMPVAPPPELAISKEVKPPSFWASAGTIVLPHKRATVTIKDRAAVPAGCVPTMTSLYELEEQLRLTDARESEPARRHLARFSAAVGAVFSTTCEVGKTCAPSLEIPLNANLRTALADARTTPDRDAVLAVDEALRKWLAGVAPTDVTGEFTLKNMPYQRYSFGLFAGAIVTDFGGSTRIKIDDNTVVRDPLSRSMTMVTLNIAFSAYDADAPKIAPQERTRYFIGAILTPEFGIGTGISVGLMRGLAVNVGVGGVLVSVPGKDLDVGSVVPANSPDDPDGLGLKGVLFAGLSYNFK